MHFDHYTSYTHSRILMLGCTIECELKIVERDRAILTSIQILYYIAFTICVIRVWKIDFFAAKCRESIEWQLRTRTHR